jgi:hypothetical protein
MIGQKIIDKQPAYTSEMRPIGGIFMVSLLHANINPRIFFPGNGFDESLYVRHLENFERCHTELQGHFIVKCPSYANNHSTTQSLASSPANRMFPICTA